MNDNEGEAKDERCAVAGPLSSFPPVLHRAPLIAHPRVSSFGLPRGSFIPGPSSFLLQIRPFSSCIFSARPRISFVSTSKLAGVPASSVFSPLTIDS